jgi:hypothetical protein
MALKIKIIIQYKNISILSPELLSTFVLANSPLAAFINHIGFIFNRPGVPLRPLQNGMEFLRAIIEKAIIHVCCLVVVTK